MLKKIFFWLFGIVGAAVFSYGAWLAAWGALSTQWPATAGRVLSSAVEDDGDVPATYGAAATYEYFVDSQRYVSKRIAFGNYRSSDPGHARQVHSRYPAGESVAVFYDPGRPGLSVLEPGVGGGAYIALGVGAAFVGYVLFMRLAQRQDAALVQAAMADPHKKAILFRRSETQPGGTKRIEVSRDGPRVLTNYPPYAVIMGALFLAAGLVLAYFGLSQADGPLLVLLGLFIATAGGLLAWKAVEKILLRKARTEAAGRSPWRFDHPWDRAGTSDDGFKPALRVLFGVAMIAMFVATMQVLMLRHAATGSRIFLYSVFGIFDLAVLAGVVKAIHLFFRAFKFGRNRLLFHSFPILTGQDVTVSFVADKQLRNQALRAELQCITEYYESSGSGNDRSSFPVFELLYSQTAEFRTDGSGIADLTFHVPTDAVPTDLVGSPPCYWELEVTAKLPGIDYRGIFLLPVYRAASQVLASSGREM